MEAHDFDVRATFESKPELRSLDPEGPRGFELTAGGAAMSATHAASRVGAGANQVGRGEKTKRPEHHRGSGSRSGRTGSPARHIERHAGRWRRAGLRLWPLTVAKALLLSSHPTTRFMRRPLGHDLPASGADSLLVAAFVPARRGSVCGREPALIPVQRSDRAPPNVPLSNHRDLRTGSCTLDRAGRPIPSPRDPSLLCPMSCREHLRAPYLA